MKISQRMKGKILSEARYGMRCVIAVKLRSMSYVCGSLMGVTETIKEMMSRHTIWLVRHLGAFWEWCSSIVSVSSQLSSLLPLSIFGFKRGNQDLQKKL